jgi:hypothetical protein
LFIKTYKPKTIKATGANNFISRPKVIAEVIKSSNKQTKTNTRNVIKQPNIIRDLLYYISNEIISIISVIDVIIIP